MDAPVAFAISSAKNVMPSVPDAPGEVPELDWDTPEKETEQILHKRGLI